MGEDDSHTQRDKLLHEENGTATGGQGPLDKKPNDLESGAGNNS